MIDALVLLGQEKAMNPRRVMAVFATSVGLNAVALAESTLDTSTEFSRSDLVHVGRIPEKSESTSLYSEKIVRSQEHS